MCVQCAVVAEAQTVRPTPRPGAPGTGVSVDADSSLLAMLLVSNHTGAQRMIGLDELVDPRSTEEFSARMADDLLKELQEANRLVRDRTEYFLKYLRAYEIDPEIVSVSTSEARAAGYAITAMDESRVRELLKKVGDESQQRSIRSEINEIRARINEALGNRNILAIYADGTIRGALNGTGDSEAAGTGSVGLGVAFANGWRLSSSIGIASSVDTVSSSFGGVVLVPGAGKGRLTSVIVDASTPKFKAKGPAIGAFGYISAASSVWRVADTGTVVFEENASVVGVGSGLYWDLLKGRLLNDVGISLRLGVAGRFLQGDIGQNDRPRIVALNGSPKRSFWGLEAGLGMQVGGILAGVQYYSLGRGESDTRIPSLTGGQIVVGIGIAAPVVSGPMSAVF